KPDYFGPRSNLAWLLATCPDPKLRDGPRAVEHAKKAVELRPQDANEWNNLGVAYYRVGDWKAAVEALEKGDRMLKGGDRVHRFCRAMAHWQLGEKEQARKWYDEAVQWLEAPTRKEGDQWPSVSDQRRFRAEAEKVMGISDKKN